MRYFFIYWLCCILIECIVIYKITGFSIKGSRTLFLAHVVVAPIATPFHIIMMLRGVFGRNILKSLEIEARKESTANRIKSLQAEVSTLKGDKMKLIDDLNSMRAKINSLHKQNREFALEIQRLNEELGEAVNCCQGDF